MKVTWILGALFVSAQLGPLQGSAQQQTAAVERAFVPVTQEMLNNPEDEDWMMWGRRWVSVTRIGQSNVGIIGTISA